MAFFAAGAASTSLFFFLTATDSAFAEAAAFLGSGFLSNLAAFVFASVVGCLFSFYLTLGLGKRLAFFSLFGLLRCWRFFFARSLNHVAMDSLIYLLPKSCIFSEPSFEQFTSGTIDKS